MTCYFTSISISSRPKEVHLDVKALQEIEQKVFRDDRWEQAQKLLGKLGRQQARELMQQGAKMYGFWLLPHESLESLVCQLWLARALDRIMS